MANPQDHKYHSVRQAAFLLGQSVATINRWINHKKIDYLQVDNFKLIHQDAIDHVRANGVVHEPKHKLPNHVTVNQAAKTLNIEFQKLKRYVITERIQNIKKDGIYFIPVDEVEYWLQISEPRNPSKVEAYKFNAVVLIDAARQLGRSVSFCRVLIMTGELKTIEGINRRYVLNSSIKAYIAVREGLNSL